MDKMICPVTGKEMSRGVRPLTLSYKGASITFDMPGWYAEGVEDGIHTGEDTKVSDRHLNLLRARIEGLLQPDDVRRIRRKLRLSQRDAGQLIGGGVNAFQKYESGEILVSRAVSSVLRVLDRIPAALEVLKEADLRAAA